MSKGIGIVVMASIVLAATGFASGAKAGISAFSDYSTDSKTVVDHGAWAAFLTAYVDADTKDGVNLVNYAGVTKKDRAALQKYIKTLSEMTPTSLNEDEAFAYWANLYNAVTVEVVLDNYPVKSIREIKSGLFQAGPWKLDLVTVAGEKLSLDNIEHDILRAFWNEPRVHYAVNCASIGCPNLAPTPYTGAMLEEDLQAAAEDYVNNPRGAMVQNGKLKLSNIYQWYRKDFGSSDREVIDHISAYAGKDLKTDLEGITRISGYDYDWSLNEVK